MSDWNKREGGQQEHGGQKKVCLNTIEERVDGGQAHIQLLGKREQFEAHTIVCRQTVAEAQHQNELPAKQWNREKKRNELTASQRITQTKPGEASQ